jgi:uncharacterized protein (TIGR02145 family)
MQGMFQPAEISAASATSGSVLYLSTNTRGFFVTASPATVTATLSNATGRFSCCAYGSDTPPNMTESNGTYTFKGTPPFTLIAADGAATQTVTENTLPASALTITPVILTDETGYPNIFCPYTEIDLYNVAAYFCQPRASGAQNWEAWIQDSRDNELYRIVFLPDNKWWTAEEIRYDASATKQSYKCPNGNKPTIYNNPIVACPTGWSLPSSNDIKGLKNFMNTAEILAEGTHQLWGVGIDKYGLSVIPSVLRSDNANGTYPTGNCRTDYTEFITMWGTSGNQRCPIYGKDMTLGCTSYSWNQARCIRN